MGKASKSPAILWYVGDWMKDDEVQAAHISTRGVWWELLQRMFVSKERGKLSLTASQYARLVSCSEAEFLEALLEIESLGIATVTRRDKIITVENRRMVREERERKSNAHRQKEYRSREIPESSVNGNAIVTPPSSSSSSFSSSFSEEGTPKRKSIKQIPGCLQSRTRRGEAGNQQGR